MEGSSRCVLVKRSESGERSAGGGGKDMPQDGLEPGSRNSGMLNVHSVEVSRGVRICLEVSVPFEPAVDVQRQSCV